MKILSILLLFLLGCVTEPEPEDYAGVPGAAAELDNCNVCDTDKTNDCVPDCNGVWGGSDNIPDTGDDASYDECGICGGSGIVDGTCDCDGKVIDEYGVCGGDGSSCFLCADCGDAECCDCNGNEYETIQIGDQLWIAENLKTTHYNDGSEIPNITNNGDWGSLSIGANGDYDNNPTNSETYSRLYTWYTVDEAGVYALKAGRYTLR